MCHEQVLALVKKYVFFSVLDLENAQPCRVKVFKLLDVQKLMFYQWKYNIHFLSLAVSTFYFEFVPLVMPL